MSEEKQFIAALDVGTTKICVLAAEVDGEGEIRIVGMGNQPSRGMKKGAMVNLETAVEAIRKAVEEAEESCGRTLGSVFTGLAGSYIQSYNSRAVVPVAKPQAGITDRDVDNAVRAAQKITLPEEQRIIHVIPQGFAVDDRSGVVSPVGMSGSRLEARVHIVTAPWGPLDTLFKAIRQAGVEVEDVFLQPLAASQAVLNKEEQQSGVVVVDIGGGTTDYVVFHNDAVRHTRSLPLGGDHVTNDVSIGLKLLVHQAEEVKKKHGCALSARVDPEEKFTSPAFGGRTASHLSRYFLAQVIELRMSEIFEHINQDLKINDCYCGLASGLVLTGGAALLDGCRELASEIIPLPARIGKPWGVAGLTEVMDSPVYSTAAGLLKLGWSHRLRVPAGEGNAGPGWTGKAARGLQSWFKKYF